MLQGTGSDVGKSLIVAGLCRAFARRGMAVRPFKPQNMSNNAAVTAEGGEIGRAQAVQALACGVPPRADMNPVLLKPQSEIGAQLVLQGRVAATAGAREYTAMKGDLLPKVLESFGRIAADADLVLVEGAGSPAEVNLREGDIANMGFAEAAGLPVVLVADIDRGGVIASLIGTHALLSPGEQARTKGYIVNKFRGDPSLFDGGIAIISTRTGLPCLGLIPWFEKAGDLPAEDAVALDRPPAPRARDDAPIRIAVPRLARIANFDDLDPLSMEPDVALDIVPAGRPLPGDADIVLLPGSKSTRADLDALRAEGWDIDIHAHYRRGGLVIGLCGGYQMLGRTIADPEGIEGAPGKSEGLGLLAVETVIGGAKTLRETGAVESSTGEAVRGYEIHMGETKGSDAARPMLRAVGNDPSGNDGAVSACGRVMGCYLHGLFGADGFRHAFLARIRRDRPRGLDYAARVEGALDALAGHMEAHADLDRLWEIADAR
ncbi:MAG: cobyric acid synthase [Rhodospirillaceae bacterium]|nr:cobyric acid synthase [Rhodospirillaceae bacterium]